MKYGIVIDLKKCIGCMACTVACKVDNNTRPGVYWNKVKDMEFGKYPEVTRIFLPVQCMQCENAPCIEVCPTGASYRRADGIVMIDSNKCVGCGYCVEACPYGARYLNKEVGGYYGKTLTPNEEVGYRKHKLGVAEKCNFCADLLEQGEEPICVRTCVGKARYFGDLDDPNSEICQLIKTRDGFQLHQDLGTKPSIYYLPV